MAKMFVLSRDWHNPDYDARKKYGRNSVRNLPKGSKVFCRSERNDPEMEAYVFFGDGDGSNAIHFDGAYLRKLLDISEEVEPRTWFEWRLCQDDSPNGGWSSNEILKTLWEDKALRPQIMAAYSQAYNRVVALSQEDPKPMAKAGRPVVKLAP